MQRKGAFVVRQEPSIGNRQSFAPHAIEPTARRSQHLAMGISLRVCQGGSGVATTVIVMARIRARCERHERDLAPPEDRERVSLRASVSLALALATRVRARGRDDKLDPA
jgi:hypothetical protein